MGVYIQHVVTDGRYLTVEVDEQDTQSKDNSVTQMYVTVLDRFHIALRKVSFGTGVCPFCICIYICILHFHQEQCLSLIHI